MHLHMIANMAHSMHTSMLREAKVFNIVIVARHNFYTISPTHSNNGGTMACAVCIFTCASTCQ